MFKNFSGKCLVLSPHLDDMELGCGGFIAEILNNNASVKVASFSYSEESLPSGYSKDDIKNESLLARNNLGLIESDSLFFDYKTRYFSYSRQDILEDMVAIKKSYTPDLVILPSSYDSHQDHRVIYEEGVRAFKNSIKLGYQLPWNCSHMSNNCKLSIDSESWSKKIKSISCYKSQLEKNTFDLEFVSIIGLFNGKHTMAESFEFIGSTNAF